jgi:hypothetical protein
MRSSLPTVKVRLKVEARELLLDQLSSTMTGRFFDEGKHSDGLIMIGVGDIDGKYVLAELADCTHRKGEISLINEGC